MPTSSHPRPPTVKTDRKERKVQVTVEGGVKKKMFWISVKPQRVLLSTLWQKKMNKGRRKDLIETLTAALSCIRSETNRGSESFSLLLSAPLCHQCVMGVGGLQGCTFLDKVKAYVALNVYVQVGER